MSVLRSVIAIVALLTITATAQAGSDPAGPRLDGVYDVKYQRKTFDPQVWNIKPTCGQGACDANLKGTDVSGRMKYDAPRGEYTIKNRYKGGICSRKNPDTGKREILLRDSLRYIETISVFNFTGGTDGAPATGAKGVIDAIAKPTAKAKRLGCTNSLTQRTVFTLKLR